MNLIRDLVKTALETGYLTLEAEEQLRKLLRKKYEQEDLEAFCCLQKAAMDGYVRQQSRDLLMS